MVSFAGELYGCYPILRECELRAEAGQSKQSLNPGLRADEQRQAATATVESLVGGEQGTNNSEIDELCVPQVSDNAASFVSKSTQRLAKRRCRRQVVLAK